MLCQNCQKRTANVHFTQIVNNKKVEMYLCEHCASEKGQIGFGAPLGIGNFFSGLMGFNSSMQPASGVDNSEVCDFCKMSYDEFKRSGKMGCGNCYKVFGDKMTSIIKRLHGSTSHIGKLPARVSESIKTSRELESLKEQLNKAIQNEEYEKAAELRDRIRSLEVGS